MNKTLRIFAEFFIVGISLELLLNLSYPFNLIGDFVLGATLMFYIHQRVKSWIKQMKQKILLVDVDSKIPNIALMKLSTFFKNKGDSVELKKLGLTYYKKPENRIIQENDVWRVYAKKNK